MKKLLLLCFLAVSLDTIAQTVGYSYRPLAAEGYNMKYSVTKQDSVYYINSLHLMDSLRGVCRVSEGAGKRRR